MSILEGCQQEVDCKYRQFPVSFCSQVGLCPVSTCTFMLPRALMGCIVLL